MTLTALRFGIQSADATDRMAVATVHNPSPSEGPGCLSDARMGTSGQRSAAVCETCGLNHHNCAGHFGRIALPHPVYNPLFVGLLATVLQCVCLHCHRQAVAQNIKCRGGSLQQSTAISMVPRARRCPSPRWRRHPHSTAPPPATAAPQGHRCTVQQTNELPV